MRVIVVLILLTAISFAQSNEKIDSSKQSVIIPNNLSELRSGFDDIFSDPNFSNSFFGVYVQSLKSGETIYKLNQDKLFKPASLVKLFTTSTALLLLGPEYRFKTSLLTDGKITEGVLYGNLFIIGGGDPTIYTKRGNGVEDDFVQWIDSLNQHGIYSIKGNVIADDNNFEVDNYGKGWLNEYQNNWFAPPSGAFCLNNNSIEINIIPTNFKEPASVAVIPAINDFEIVNKVVTSDASSVKNIIAGRSGKNIIKLTGSIPIYAKPYSYSFPFENPTECFINNFYESLLEEGIVVTGYATSIEQTSKKHDLDKLKMIFESESAPLSEIVHEINKSSNNLYAEQIIRTIGFELYGFGNTANGITAMNNLLETMGINPGNIKIVDGSGLSTFDLATPKQIVNLLSYMYKSDAFSDFYNSLSVAGFDGTLADRMKKTKSENNFRGKAGYLENTSSLAGFIKTADGEPLALTLIVNNFLVPSQLASYILDKVCNRLANFTRN